MKNNRIVIVSAAVLTLIIGLLGCGGGSSDSPVTADPKTPDPVIAVTFTNSQAADVVIGQADFVSSFSNRGGAAAANTINSPYGNPYVDSGVLYLPDYSNNRVLVFNSIPATNGAAADFAIGQPDLVTTTSGTSATLIDGPQPSVVHNGKLVMTEFDNNRISIYNDIPTSGPGTIDVVVGQSDKTSSASACTATGLNNPETVVMAGDKLVVTDTSNHRVLIWNSIPTIDNQPADLVLGQSDFTNCNLNRGGSADADTLAYPAGVWSDGTRLVVADSENSRVLIWNSIPISNGQAADLVLGQSDFTSTTDNQGGTPSATTMNYPYDGVYFNGAQLFVADFDNNRVLVWNSFPTTNGQAADTVLGQPNFVTNTPTTSATGVDHPTGVFLYQKQLVVTDTGNSRYLIFNGM